MLLSDGLVREGSSSISAGALRVKTIAELERIVRDNLHNPAVLRIVHHALRGRTRKRAVRLRTEIRERLGLDRATGAPSPDIPIWTRAPAPPGRPWYRKWRFLLTMPGFVVVGVLHGVGLRLWQMIHQGLVSLSERF